MDANETALNKYILEKERAERKYEEFIEALRTEVLPLYSEAKVAYNLILDRYCYNDAHFNFCEEIKNL